MLSLMAIDGVAPNYYSLVSSLPTIKPINILPSIDIFGSGTTRIWKIKVTYTNTSVSDALPAGSCYVEITVHVFPTCDVVQLAND